MTIAGTLRRLERTARNAGVAACRHCLGTPQVAIIERLGAGPYESRVREPLCAAYKEAFVGWRDDSTWPVADLRCRWCGHAVDVVILQCPG